MDWPKRPYMWLEGRTLMVSVPFTWNLPDLKAYLSQRHAHWDNAVVGGPAVRLMPEYLDGIPNVMQSTGDYPGVLQLVNPFATRTTTGCIRRCQFCGIGTRKIEGDFEELVDWPDLPLICDNNLLASSQLHFDRVIDRLEKHRDVDFNQGLDARLLTSEHAQRFARLKSPKIRLSCDSAKTIPLWEEALETLISNGVKRSWISTYALIGFDSDPAEAWERTELIEAFSKHGCLPMWFHPLNALQENIVTQKQAAMGWTNKERIRIMRRYYWQGKD